MTKHAAWGKNQNNNNKKMQPAVNNPMQPTVSVSEMIDGWMEVQINCLLINTHGKKIFNHSMILLLKQMDIWQDQYQINAWTDKTSVKKSVI